MRPPTSGWQGQVTAAGNRGRGVGERGIPTDWDLRSNATLGLYSKKFNFNLFLSIIKQEIHVQEMLIKTESIPNPKYTLFS